MHLRRLKFSLLFVRGFRLRQTGRQNVFEFFDFGRCPIIAIQNIIRVTNHAHHGQLTDQLLLFLLKTPG
jgi:fumarate reductase subunit C